MKKKPSHLPLFGAWLFILSFLLLPSCYNWTLSPELVGTWESENTEITVRTKTAEKEWIFTTDSARISVTIHADQRVTGSIGAANFDKGKIRKNAGNPEKRSLTEIIECGSIGKIFESDPEESKDVQLWLSPLEDQTIDTELRFTGGMARFPMAGFILKKVGD